MKGFIELHPWLHHAPVTRVWVRPDAIVAIAPLQAGCRLLLVGGGKVSGSLYVYESERDLLALINEVPIG